MEQYPPPTHTPTTPTTTTTATTAAVPTEPPSPQPPPQQLQQEQSAPPPPSSAATPTITTTNPNPNPNTPPPSKPTLPQPRPSSFSRPWQQQQQQQQQHHSHFAHFSSPAVTPPIPAPQRGGIAIGVPATRPTASPPQPAAPFSPSFGQQFGGLGRGGVNVPDSVSPSQVRPQLQGMQGMGMMGSLGSSSQMRPGGISVQHHQQRPVQQSPIRPPPSSPNSQSPATQNFQGQGLMRVSSVGSPGSPSPSTSQSTHNQPWLSSGPQGKPPLPPPTSYRSQMNSPSMQQRAHIPQPHNPLSTASQQHVPSVQPQPKPSHQLQEHYEQLFPSSRVSQSLPHQQQITRTPGSAIQKASSLGTVQPTAVQAGTQSRIASAEIDESGNRILSKRSISELVNQIDPSERLDPEVEDILADIAEDFVDSITTFGCSLAKHRKSNTLEAKDVLLHLERNWNMTLPGFGGDEIKTYRKPLTNDIHKERLAAIKKSIMVTEVANTKTSVGQATATAKGNLGKIPSNIIGST
ncbi:hypothetical protein Ddye_008386 [Dipteronia dyeriana]|uniref:Transcription initiation factor TFIID subunit 12 domain-containing protein n=1 Tax=Dipteronia dyeriana TaxID=168575 RepID=A0AAD9X9K3_9ROSI|nr:hypothetical protein Ddye_008386 [Dipteronia dyeriana]